MVLPLPTTVFIPRDLALQQYPTATRTAFITGLPVKVDNCPPFNTRTHNGECPNGDALIGGLCAVPINGAASPGVGSSQVFTGSGDRPVAVSRAAASSADGRVS